MKANKFLMKNDAAELTMGSGVVIAISAVVVLSVMLALQPTINSFATDAKNDNNSTAAQDAFVGIVQFFWPLIALALIAGIGFAAFRTLT